MSMGFHELLITAWTMSGLRVYEVHCRSVGDFEEATRINALVCMGERLLLEGMPCHG